MSQVSRVQQRTACTHQLSNGLVLVGEPTEAVQSAAFTLLVPSGYSTDPADRLGLSSLLCDMVLRGAGERDSRALINDLEILGVERGESVGASQTSLSAATVASNLFEALEIYADIVLRPGATRQAARRWQARPVSRNYGVPRTNRVKKLMMAPTPTLVSRAVGVRSSMGTEGRYQRQHLERSRRAFFSRGFRPQRLRSLASRGILIGNNWLAKSKACFADWQPVKVSDPTDFASENSAVHFALRFQPMPRRHRLSERALPRSRLPPGLGCRRSAQRRDELAIVLPKSEKKTRPLLHRQRVATNTARTRACAVLLPGTNCRACSRKRST